ncbi:hypothetical protein SAMN03159382_00281 [Pseudomonas sp. NFACC23-1]|nr:hypothetical protein SAMN03159386_00068 [Pseudomonas sp. NFACC17-2]SEI84531.1 hypothetical protein SAMN03159382_00281 [Pseudomonas sp. NFACC23-1]SFW23480.1 hypothetical protein SAMN05660640_00559 [Pseudomonas sp. NFACC16-2]
MDEREGQDSGVEGRSSPTGFLIARRGGVYIHFCGNGRLGFRPDGGSLSKSAKVTKALLPHHSVPRLGSACLNEGIAPWAAAKGHPWPSAANPASMPGCPLHNACVRPSWLTGRPRSTSATRRPDSRPGSWWDRVSPVGAGLLAKAVDQFAVMLNVPASSRASSLPQRGCGVHKVCGC